MNDQQLFDLCASLRSEVEYLDVRFWGHKPNLTVMTSSEESREKVLALLRQYEADFNSCEVNVKGSRELEHRYIRRMNFYGFRKIVRNYLRWEINRIAAIKGLEPLYAFALSSSWNHYSVEVCVNSEANWQRLVGSGKETYSKYQPPDFSYKLPSGKSPEQDALFDWLTNCEDIRSQFCELQVDMAYFEDVYAVCFNQILALGLMDVVPELTKLPRTPDFVYYVSNFAGDSSLLDICHICPEALTMPHSLWESLASRHVSDEALLAEVLESSRQ
jgi:hypothetical protein